MVNTTQSKILAGLKKKSKGAYKKAKKVEPKAGGRTLPGGLKDAVGIATGMKLDVTKDGRPYVYLYANTEEPEEFKGVFCGVMWTLAEDKFSSYEDNLSQFLGDMKLLGFEEEVESAEDEQEAISSILDFFADETKKHPFRFNTGRRPQKDGSYRIFVAGTCEDYEPTAPEAENEAEDEGYTVADLKGLFREGQRVSTINDFFGDGSSYVGTVQSCEDGVVSVLFDDDGSISDVPVESLVHETEDEEAEAEEEAEEEGDESAALEVGDAVTTIDDYFETGDEYTGTIVSIKGGKAKISFDNGDEDALVPLEFLAPVE